ncbi:MAG: ComEC/Rec2 family competence protein [Campylobacter sp.]|nr:ComEC/Rec2 family competence protein [Campylobacter sp.]
MKLKLFYNKKEFCLFSLFIVLILALNLAFKYHEFCEFKANSRIFLQSQILNSYDKTNDKGRTYTVLKLKSGNFTIYTTTKTGREFPRFSRVSVGIITQNLSFLDFVKARFYAPNFKISAPFYENSPKTKAINFIRSQHENQLIADLYSALYFATPMPYDLRQNITHWGIAHIVSISGFHLGIIFSSFFLIFAPIYRILQRRFFPWRNLKFDLSVTAILLMIGYLFVLDFTPSFLRSLAMCVVGFFLLWRNFELLNFANLFLSIALLLAVFPYLAFSVGFYFSSLGVLYIFLYSHHFWGKFGTFANLALFNLYVWFAMNIAVYFFFPLASFQQLSVIIIGYIFVIFYPLSVVLHLCGLGGVFDEALISFLNFTLPSFKAQIPLPLFVLANLCALGAIRSKTCALICPILGILPIFFVT